MSEQVILYTTPNCNFCRKVKEFLKNNNIKFEEYDVSSDEGKKEELIKKSGQLGVPVIDINGKILTGYRPSEMAEALKL